MEKRALLENMEGLFLAVDEIVDGGYVFDLCTFKINNYGKGKSVRKKERIETGLCLGTELLWSEHPDTGFPTWEYNSTKLLNMFGDVILHLMPRLLCVP